MVIKTKSIYEPSEENDDGIRVLIKSSVMDDVVIISSKSCVQVF